MPDNESDFSSDQEQVSNLVSLTSAQRAIVSLYNTQIGNFTRQYLPVARKVGELTEQLEFAKQEEKRIRANLSQIEVERTTALKSAAHELGYTGDQDWRYLEDQFAFEKLDVNNK